MHDNNTVKQLSDALNELLNAYDKLKSENSDLEQENKNKNDKINELEILNSELEEQIGQLTDTTEHNTNEIDTMLGRIKTILDEKPEQVESPEERYEHQNQFAQSDEEVTDIFSNEVSELSLQEQTIIQTEEEDKPPSSSSDKEIDLGRMQSLLNGFNN